VRLTLSDARKYGLALLLFYGGLVAIIVREGTTSAQLTGGAAFFLFIPIGGGVGLMWLAWDLTRRDAFDIGQLPPLITWRVCELWLICGFAIPDALRSNRRR
jgi:hypothetical protein